LKDREGNMTIIGYGEDGLTYKALATQLHLILPANDQTDPENCTIFYRPSFGRAGGNTSCQFGEFDAIVASPNAVYLIESKWDHLTDQERPVVVLGDVQILRHRIFTWLLDAWRKWRQGNPANLNWADFREEANEDFKREFRYRPLAGVNTLLAENLAYILHALEGQGRQTLNLLLYFNHNGARPANQIANILGQPTNPAFTLVNLPYANLENSGYFWIVP
jgi:hypothetical protein